MAVVFSDTFTAANGTTLQAHDATWVKNTADAPVDVLVKSGGIVLSSGEAASTYINTTAGSLTDQLVEVDIVFATATNGIHGVVARASSVAREYYIARWNAGYLQLYKFDATTVVQLGSSVAQSVTVGSTHRIGLRCVGNQISLEWDGVTKIGPITDSTYASGYAGLRLISTGAVLLDNFSVDNLAAATDSTAPTLTSPSATATGATTASGSVSTNEANGTLYYLASANATETDVAVKAGSSQAVTATGEQLVTITGLTAATPYYPHYLHRDAAGNDSAVASGVQFTTDAPSGDTDPPTLTGSVTFTNVTQTSYTASWPAGLDNVAVTGYEYQIGSTAGAWTDTGNNLSAAITGRTAGATETVYVRAYDAAGLRSTPAISGEVTLLAATASVTSDEFKNNTGTLLASSMIPKVWLIPFGTPDYTNFVTNGAGELVISEAGLSGDYLIVTANADGTEVGVSKATAS